MEAMETFPRDVVVNILSRLPVKYLVQLKCILFLHSASWIRGCEGSGVDHVKQLEYPAIMKNIPGFGKLHKEIAGSCNGLMCVVFSNGCIFLWNPTIREALELNSGDFDPEGYIFMALAMITPLMTTRSKAEILARKSGIWRKIEGLDFVLEKGPEIFLHGALHWLETRASDAEEIVIVAFDMAEEKFYELVQLPDSMGKKKHLGQMFLMISEDSLCLFCGGGGAPTTYIDAWRLNEYGFRSSWTRLFGENRCTIPDIVGWGNALYYTKSGKIVLDYMGINLMWYDPKENT
ncbi:hypothetical protein V6N11_044295 [Hibiscus sabdariffa]|uniref:F-box associated beta-propeller type 1 domain-containing protein n=1 Tax=Hibiscus sabdariffa TaxID=183260 RepID=A0ABR2REV2_9ROSI